MTAQKIATRTTVESVENKNVLLSYF